MHPAPPADDETPIETARLRLEPLVAAHAAELLEALGDPELYRFIPHEPPSDLAALAARCARLATRRSPDGRERWLNWAVRERATGRCVGRVEATVRDPSHADIAYLFATWAHGRGFATEACRAMIDRLVGTYRVAVLEATIDTRNARSIALVERLGFRRVETRLAADVIRGEPSDESRYRWTAT